MFGNLQVRFLGGSGAARLPSYPVYGEKTKKPEFDEPSGVAGVPKRLIELPDSGRNHMIHFGKIKKVNLRDIWSNEAHHFTPWLADNINALGDALGLELELSEREASVGNFSLDLLAKDLGSGDVVVIENQFANTDHDHLGKLLTYAAGFNAAKVIWIAENIREEHRQTLEWLNQRTDTDTQFFAVVIEVIQIDDSKPAYNFKPVVFPNEFQKSKRSQKTTQTSTKSEAYRNFFQGVIDDLREIHKYTSARLAQPQSWYSFSSGNSGVTYGPAFAQGKRVRVEVYIDLGDADINKALFDELLKDKDAIEADCQTKLDWDRLDEKRASRISVSKSGVIEASEDELREIHAWMIDNLLKFKKAFSSRVKACLKKIKTA